MTAADSVSRATVQAIDAPQRSFWASLWLRRRSLVRLALLAGVLGGGVTYFLPRDWTTSGAFVIQESKPDAAGGLAGLTSKFGIDLSSSSGGYSPRFFAWLLESDAVLGTIAGLKLKAPSADAGQTVTEVLEIEGRTREIQHEETVAYLRANVVTALYDQRPEITVFTVTTGDPQLSLQIAAGLFAELNRFATERHRSRASVERKFVEERRQATMQELRVAEDALASYVIRHRAYQQSPEQAIEMARLSRRVGDLQTVQSMLTETFEKARIEEVRDTPVLSSLSELKAPAIPDRRSRIEWVFAAMSLVLFAALAILALQQLLKLAPLASSDDPRSFGDVWPTLKGELTHPWRLVI